MDNKRNKGKNKENKKKKKYKSREKQRDSSKSRNKNNLINKDINYKYPKNSSFIESSDIKIKNQKIKKSNKKNKK